ncbi:hypothetical protein X777_10989, partial [Ooceraea biroi]
LMLACSQFTSQIGDAAAERDDTSISSVEKPPGKVILEEMIITGSGDDTRMTADAVAKNSTQIEDEILSLLSKREIRKRHARRPSSKSDQDANQSSTVIVDVRNDEVDLERLKHAIAEYEPRRIVSRKTKRKIVDGLNATHDVRGISGESAGSANEDLQRTYHEVLRNISQGMPTIIATNAGAATFNPYLSQATKSLKQTRVPEVTASTDDAEKSSSLDINSSYTPLATLKSKKTKKLLKKYLQPNRTATASGLSSIGGSKPDEEAGNNGSTEVSVPSRKPKNVSLSTQSPSNAYSNPTEKPRNLRQWNLQESSTTIPSFISPNNSNAYNVLSIYNLNVPNGANNLYLPRYKAMPRPFSISQLPNSPVTNNLEVSHPKPSSSSVNLDPQSITRSSGNVLPLVLPTDLFNPAATRRYVPIKRANRVNPNGNSMIITEASPSTSPLGGGITFEKSSADYGAPYANVIGTARNPPVAANGHQSSRRLDYYPIMGNPAERTVAETTKTATTYVPGQTSALYDLQRLKDPQVIRKNGFLPRIDTHGSPDVGKSDPNFNIGLALYNKFANFYTAHKYRHYETPQKDSRHEEHRREEYSETNPKHVRKEYHHHHHQPAKDDHHDHHRHDDENHDKHHDDQEVYDHIHGETQEHAHKHKEHHEKKKDEEDHNFEKGEGSELEAEHHGHEGEKGHKGYKVWHEHDKTEKGHHDKEHATKEYDEKDGEEKKHEEEGGYHEEHHHGGKGEKTAEFDEKGEHKKGHSTHGEHSVHKKDEYEKKTEFFDEFHEDGDMEKHGEHHHEHESKKGGHEKKGHHDAANHEEKYGKKEKHEKGDHHHEHKGHKVEEGHDHHHDHDEKYGKKEGHEHGKKWSFKKGDDGGSAGGGHKHDR